MIANFQYHKNKLACTASTYVKILYIQSYLTIFNPIVYHVILLFFIEMKLFQIYLIDFDKSFESRGAEVFVLCRPFCAAQKNCEPQINISRLSFNTVNDFILVFLKVVVHFPYLFQSLNF